MAAASVGMLTVSLAVIVAARPVVAAPPLVHTSLGAVRGNALLHADEFLGMPYATAKRFEPAVLRTERFAAEPFDATYYGPACKQTLNATATYGVEHGCHVLNVWRPAGASADALLPVMLFIPGGSNDFGEAEPYNASEMASNQRAVIASANYRVGPFGFAAFKEDHTRGVTTGNHALTDHQAALRFVRRHIRAFGGDPRRLTLFGQSSAGGLTLLHAVAPSSAGLVEGLLAQSADLSASPLDYSVYGTDALKGELNCTKGAATKACLLAASADALVFAEQATGGYWSPTVDGVMIPDDPSALVAAGKVNRLSVALGANTNDSYHDVKKSPLNLTRAKYLSELRAEAGGDAKLAAALVKMYPPDPTPGVDQKPRKGWYYSDRMMCGMRRTSKALAAARTPVHFYRYNYWFQSNASCTAEANYHPTFWGSCHEDEVSFVFGQPIYMDIGYTNCSVPGWKGYSKKCEGCEFDPKEAGFALAVGRLWTSYAKDGNPNDAAAAEEEWPEFGASGGRNVLIQPPALWLPGVPQRMRSEADLGRPAQCALWDSIAELAAAEPTSPPAPPLAPFTPLTVYHVNPASYAPTPLNMDTGDAVGDLYFDMREIALPIQCAHEPESEDCANVEASGNDLVVTKLTLEVRKPFGKYGMCNVCVNGTDHHGNNSCVDGAYWCRCGWIGHEQCGPAVGFENVTKSHPTQCGHRDPDYKCWRAKVAAKFPGLWYSTVSAGYCGPAGSPSPPGCTWRVKEVVKIINKTCSNDKVFITAEQDAHGAPCFAKCTDSGVGLHRRNTSSPCWIRCLYSAVLGPEAATPGAPIGGMPLSTLAGAWDAAFERPEEGGCPALPVPPGAGTLAAMRAPLSNGARWHGFPGFSIDGSTNNADDARESNHVKGSIDPTVCPNRSATFPDFGDEPDCKLPCGLSVPYHGGSAWSMTPALQPAQGPGALKLWAANMAKAGGIMRDHGTVIDTESGPALHVSLQYLCCQTAADVAIVEDIYKTTTWVPRNLTFERAVCRTDYDDAEHGMYTSVIVLLDQPSNVRMEAFAASIEDEIERRGVKLTQRRAQQQPFHSTLGAAHTKRPGVADGGGGGGGVASSYYPIVEAVEDINRQIGEWHSEPIVVKTPSFSASPGPAALSTPPWDFVPSERHEFCIGDDEGEEGEEGDGDARWVFLALPKGTAPPKGWPLYIQFVVDLFEAENKSATCGTPPTWGIKPFTAFATPKETLASCYPEGASSSVKGTAPPKCVYDQASGALWDQRLKQYLVANGVAVLQLHPRSMDLWDNNELWWKGKDPQGEGGKDRPWLEKVFAKLHAGSLGKLDLSRLVMHGWSGGAHMVSWLIQQLFSKGVAYKGVYLAGSVMLSGGSYACYYDPKSKYGPMAPIGSCAGCVADGPSHCAGDARCSSCEPSVTPFCIQCCPRNYTEQHFADHPADWPLHPPTFLAQMRTNDIHADLCATRHYHEALLSHGVRSELHLVEADDEGCFCVGDPSNPAAAGSPYAGLCKQPGWKGACGLHAGRECCVAHTEGFAEMVEPAAHFVLEAVSGR